MHSRVVGLRQSCSTMSFDIRAHRERRPMSIDEDLVATGVPEATSLLLVAEQSVWKAREGSECLEIERGF